MKVSINWITENFDGNYHNRKRTNSTGWAHRLKCNLGDSTHIQTPPLSTGNWIRVVRLGKEIVPQLFNKFSSFYGIRTFVTMFTRSLYLFLTLATWIHSTPFHSVSLKSVVILNIYVWVFKGASFLQNSPPNGVYFSSPPLCHIPS
jgi:hypothetical protein